MPTARPLSRFRVFSHNALIISLFRCEHTFSERKNCLCQQPTRFRRGKKTKGRKRHIATDTLGCLLALKVHKANLHDTKSGIFTALEAYRKYPTIRKYCADSGYRGSFVNNVKTIFGLDVDISAKIIPQGWKVVPKRWIVERTFAWLNNSRRLSGSVK